MKEVNKIKLFITLTLEYLLGEIDFNFDIRRNSSFHSYQTRGSND